MLHRDQAIAARELRSHGFRPGASETSANASFYKTTQDLMARLNEAAGTEVVTKLGQKRASRYAVNPNLALSDLRTEEDLAREVIDPRYRGGGKINPDFTRSSERISAGNLYARLIDLDRIPEVPLREGLTPVEIAIVDNTTLRIGDENVRLGAHERYLFNALMLLRDKQNAARNLRVFGFHPEAEYATATVVFSKTANSLLEQLNNAAGIEIIRRLGQRRSTCYVVNPRLLLTDLRTDEDRAAEIFDLPSSGRRASGSRSEGEFHELTSEGDLYERIIDAERIPTLDIRDGTPIELLVDDNNTLRFGGETIQLGAHARYIFNALMLLREAPASGGELRQFGFFPGAKQGTALMAFSKEMTSLIEQLNEAVGVEIFKKVGERRNMRYAVNPNLVLIDNRTDEDKARQVTDQPKRRGRRPSHERFAAQGKSTYKGPAFEGSEEEVERYDDTDRRTLLITELAQRYSNHPLVLEAIGKLNNGAPITVGLDQPYFRYLAEISQYDLLDAADEVRLFKILEKGINAYKDQGITPKNEHALIDSVIARQIVYVSNLRLVIDHAKQWGFYSRRGMGLLDFVQEGNIGLADAIDRFDYRLGFKFSTYATWWIRQGIQRSDADKSRLIRIPVHMHDKLIQFSRTVRELTSELDRDPNPWEIAYKFGEPVSEVLKLQHYTQLEPASLNALLEDADKRRSGGGISNTEGIDQIADPANPMEEAEQEADDAAFIEHIFSSERLTLKEKYVLSFRLGFEVESLKDTVLDFGDGTVLPYEDILEQMSDTEAKGYTLEEGGQLFGVTRERIRQIEKKALEKVRTRYQREQRNA
ncbi:sigma-70 family RNA polymerase sigma factor [Candidatus Saccharibacteria bacterium]|nr:sigma-70 family RNA polymerase sigma factor [Candidatus Saccharibacteria bacterium]